MDEFSMLYHDWMVSEKIEIEETYVAKDMAMITELKYPGKISKEVDEKFDFMYDKALATHQKLAMMMYAKRKLIDVKSDFEATQNMCVPALYGMGKTRILFYFESMIVFARNALDVAAYVYSDLLFDERIDSFNKFIKKVEKSSDPMLDNLKDFFKYKDDELSALRLLCGSEKGRAMRDIIVHQANVRMGYYEYKENSEQEHLFLEIKDVEPFDIDAFLSYFTQDVIDILEEANVCCQRKLRSK